MGLGEHPPLGIFCERLCGHEPEREQDGCEGAGRGARYARPGRPHLRRFVHGDCFLPDKKRKQTYVPDGIASRPPVSHFPVAARPRCDANLSTPRAQIANSEAADCFTYFTKHQFIYEKERWLLRDFKHYSLAADTLRQPSARQSPDKHPANNEPVKQMPPQSHRSIQPMGRSLPTSARGCHAATRTAQTTRRRHRRQSIARAVWLFC